MRIADFENESNMNKVEKELNRTTISFGVSLLYGTPVRTITVNRCSRSRIRKFSIKIIKSAWMKEANSFQFTDVFKYTESFYKAAKATLSERGSLPHYISPKVYHV